MATHKLKLQKQFCDAVLRGEKSFELRTNDRGFQKGDLVCFRAVGENGIDIVAHPIQDEIFEITYVLNGWGLQNGYVALAIKRKGKWINAVDTSGGDYYRCSACGTYIEKVYFANDYMVNFCPNCGAKMEEV